MVLIHRELPEHYENEFRQGLVLFIKGLEEPDAEAALDGQRRLSRFGDWYSDKLRM